MYTSVNFKTKKALKQSLEVGAKIGIWQAGPFGGNEPQNGTVYLEGPWYPEPHRWYASAVVENGYIVKVK